MTTGSPIPVSKTEMLAGGLEVDNQRSMRVEPGRDRHLP